MPRNALLAFKRPHLSRLENRQRHAQLSLPRICFGLAKINENLLGDDATKSLSLTGGVGNELFMSPEMMREEEYDNKTDVYSFGIVLYFIFVGELPHQTLREKIMLEKIILPVESPSISKCCIDLISKCISPSPKERPSFNEILDYLRKNNYILSSDVDPLIVKQRDDELESI